MSDRGGLHPLVWLGAGAAGFWGASRYLWPRRATGRPATVAPTVAAPARAAVALVPASPAAAPAAPARPSSGAAPTLTRAFDPLFRERGRGLPVAYLRALAWAESRLRPEVDRGLLQIVDVTRTDYAQRHQREPSSLNVRDPQVNVAIAADTLTRIKASLAKNHAGQVHVAEDWTNPRFVELLSYSWNAGWSESRGVGRVLDYLDARGKLDATIDDIAASARAAGAVSWLYAYPARMLWARGVAARYQAERARDVRDGVTA